MRELFVQIKSTPKILRRMFFYNYLVFLMLFLIIFAAALGFGSYQRLQSIREKAASHSQSLTEYFDSLFSSFNRLSVTVGHNTRLLALANDPVSQLDFSVLDSTSLFLAQKELVSPLAMDSNIANLAVYFYGKDYVVSSYGTSTLDSFYQSLFSMDANPVSGYLRPLSAGSFLFLPRSEDKGAMLAQNSVYVISLVQANGTRYGNLFIFWDDREIQQRVESLLEPNESYYIFTSRGESVLQRGAPAEEQELAGSADFFGRESKGGWRVYVGAGPGYVNGQLLFLALMAAFLYAAVALLGAPVVFSLCRRNYKPIRELAELVARQDKPQGGPARKALDYEALKLAISSIFKDKSRLEEQLEIYKPVLINSLLLQLLEGSGDSSSILKGLETLGAPVPFPWFLCVSLYAASIHREDFVGGALSMRGQEGLSCLFASVDKHTGYYLVNASSAGDCRRAAAALTESLERSGAVGGIGLGCCGTAASLSESYRQAREALGFLNAGGAGKCVAWESLEPLPRRDPPFPHGAFSSQLLSGQFAEADRELQRYWKKTAPYGVMRRACLEEVRQCLAASLLQIKKEYGLPCCEELLRSLRAWDSHGAQALPQLTALWEQVKEELAQDFLRQKEEKASEDARAFLDYLQEHVYEEDMSLSKMAASFHVSESTVSRRIKALTGYSFLDYVANKRIAQACSLLSETEMSVQEVAAATGYLNDITFRRLFKKQIGVTPSEYRQRGGR